MKDTRNVEFVGIKISAKAGSVLYDCLRDAAIIALQEDVDVAMTHNGVVYNFNASNLTACHGKS